MESSRQRSVRALRRLLRLLGSMQSECEHESALSAAQERQRAERSRPTTQVHSASFVLRCR